MNGSMALSLRWIQDSPRWIQEILSPSRFIPHGHCYLWEPGLVWLHVLSDVLIAIAYFSIPLMLVYFVQKREDVPFRGIFLLFSLFIVTCGTTHLMSVWTLWHPAYWLAGVIKAVTAVVSVYTALTLLPTIPQALALPSIEKMRQINRQLEKQRVSEERWQLALIGTNDGIWDWDLETNEVFMSPRFKQMLGYEADAWPNDFDEWAKRVHPDDIDRVVGAMQAHTENKTPFYMTEHRFLSGDGDYKWVLDRAKVLRDDTGKAIRMTGSTSDITDRKQAEAALKQLNQDLERRVEERTAAVQKSELRFRSLFESAPDFIYILDGEGIIQQVNPMVVSCSGYAEAELVAQPLTRFFSSEAQVRCQSDFSDLLIESNHRQEMDFVCKDDRVLTMDCSCTVVNNDEAEDYILVLQRDITQRKKNDKERAELLATLQESERRWQSFLDNVQLLVLGLDTSAQINYVNPCLSQLMDIPKSQAVGKNWFDSFSLPAERQQGQAAFQDILNRTDHPNYETSLMTKSGEERIISWNTTLLQDTYGNSVGTLSIGEDITERHAIDRMKNEFISVVSHELRTPLTSIHGALDLLGSGLIDPLSERGQHVFAIAVENSDRLVKLVNDILELERLESGKINLNPSSVSTQELTHRTFELMELMAERADMTLVMPETDLLVWADSDRIIQVLTNLVGNAIKFSDAPAKVWVTVEHIPAALGERGREFVKFTVKDEGRGIPREKVDGIFERFHQVDASDSRRKGGTGLGLAICRSIIEQHGGHISVHSVLKKGSEFFFTVPMDAPHLPTADLL